VIALTVWGSQWRGFYGRSIAFNTISTISTATVARSDGKQYYFNLANGVYVGDSDVVGTLVETGVDASGNPIGWTYTNENDEVETYNAPVLSVATGQMLSQLVSITNRSGLTQTLTYSDGTTGPHGGYVLSSTGVPTTVALPAGDLIRVTDPSGRLLQYGYDVVGRVVLMTDPIGGTYLYTYSDAVTLTANLTSVTYPDGKVRSYLYGETANVSSSPNTGVVYTNSLTGILDEDGNRYASWTYDANGLATSSEHGAFGSGIDHVGLVYGTVTNSVSTTSVTDPRGTVRTYNFSTILGVVKNTGITGSPCNGCTATFTYDANGNVASKTDFTGNTTCYAYDQVRNLELTRVEGLAPGVACPAVLASYNPTTGTIQRKIRTQWNASFRLPALVAEPLHLTTYTYDTLGNVLTKTVQPTADTTGANGLSVAVIGTPRTWTYTYNTAGEVLTANGPRTDVSDITTYTYDALYDLSSVSNALSQITTLTNYDANGRPGTLTNPNGLITTLTFDARGRLTSRVTGGETTGYSYDGAGNLITVSLPSGATYTYTYDAAHRLTRITDNLGNHVNYTLDVMGNRTLEQVFNAGGTLAQTHSRVFDALNRLYQDIGAVNQTTTFAYDADGNLTTVTDPLNRQSARSYDALNRLISNTDPATGVTHYGYDELNQLAQVIDPRTLTTQYTRDGLGNLNQQTSPDTGTSTNTYDAAGNLLTHTDAKGQVGTYTYDALNRPSGITYSGTTTPLTVVYTYDQGTNGIGYLTQIADITGTVKYSYDQHGRLNTETDQPAGGGTYTTSYSYDTQGRLASLTYPSGRVVNYSFDGMGRISQLSTTLSGTTHILASSVVYEPFGGVHGFNFGDGVTAPVQRYTRQRDQDGRIASYTLNGDTLSIGYDAGSQISFISDPLNATNPANYTYDPDSRLASYTQSTTSQSFNYDLDGNRTSQTVGGTTSSYTRVTASNRLASILTGSTTQTLTQDANGATTVDATRQYSYDLRGRLSQVTTAQGVITYSVNARGLRVRKQVPYAGTDTGYFYDTQGHLIGEAPTGTTLFTKEYIYLGDQPVAVMQ